MTDLRDCYAATQQLIIAERKLVRSCLARLRKGVLGTSPVTDVARYKALRVAEEDFIRFFGTQCAAGASIEYAALHALMFALEAHTDEKPAPQAPTHGRVA